MPSRAARAAARARRKHLAAKPGAAVVHDASSDRAKALGVVLEHIPHLLWRNNALPLLAVCVTWRAAVWAGADAIGLVQCARRRCGATMLALISFMPRLVEPEPTVGEAALPPRPRLCQLAHKCRRCRGTATDDARDRFAGGQAFDAVLQRCATPLRCTVLWKARRQFVEEYCAEREFIRSTAALPLHAERRGRVQRFRTVERRALCSIIAPCGMPWGDAACEDVVGTALEMCGRCAAWHGIHEIIAVVLPTVDRGAFAAQIDDAAWRAGHRGGDALGRAHESWRALAAPNCAAIAAERQRAMLSDAGSRQGSDARDRVLLEEFWAPLALPKRHQHEAYYNVNSSSR